MTTNRMGLTPEQAANSLTDNDLENAINLANNDTLGNVFRELLAYRKASKEPVAWVRYCSDGTIDGPLMNYQVEDCRKSTWTPLYAAPPLQAVTVPDAIEPDYDVIKGILPTSNPDEYACCIAADMWNACRNAMLKSATNEP